MRNTPPTPRRVRTAQQSKSATVRAAAETPSRRQQSHWQREQRQQRTLFVAIGVLGALVLAVFAAGVFYDNVVRANEVVAQIGSDNITATQLVDEMRPAARSLESQAKQLGSGANVTQYVDQQRRALPDQTLNQLIDQLLIEQEAAKRGITVSTSEVDDKVRQAVADYEAATNPAPTPVPSETPEAGAAASATPAPPTAVPTLEESAYGAALQRLLERGSLTEANLRKQVQQGLLRDKLQTAIGQELVADTQEQVHARHILVATADQASNVVSQLQNGADFARLAQLLSTDPGSKDKGGDLGWFGRGVMNKPFEDAAFALEPGQVSDVVQSPNGSHLIELLERDPARAVPTDQVARQRQKAFSDWLGTHRSQDVKLQLSQSERAWVLGRMGVRP